MINFIALNGNANAGLPTLDATNFSQNLPQTISAILREITQVEIDISAAATAITTADHYASVIGNNQYIQLGQDIYGQYMADDWESTVKGVASGSQEYTYALDFYNRNMGAAGFSIDDVTNGMKSLADKEAYKKFFDSTRAFSSVSTASIDKGSERVKSTINIISSLLGTEDDQERGDIKNNILSDISFKEIENTRQLAYMVKQRSEKQTREIHQKAADAKFYQQPLRSSW